MMVERANSPKAREREAKAAEVRREADAHPDPEVAKYLHSVARWWDSKAQQAQSIADRRAAAKRKREGG